MVTGLKANVDLSQIKPQILVGLQILLPIFQAAGVPLFVTSGCDGTHHAGSLHAYGYAFDLRSATKYGKDSAVDVSLLEQGRDALNGQFDFIIEGEGTENVHFHLEWDARRAGVNVA